MKIILSAVLLCLVWVSAYFIVHSLIMEHGMAHMTIPADGIAQFRAQSRGYSDDIMKSLADAAVQKR